MKAQAHYRRFPSARASTLAHLIQQEKKTAELVAEVEATVGAILVADLETALSGMSHDDLRRIAETY